MCDLQGALNEGCPPIYELTDPAIHYASSRGRTNVYGRSDQGLAGIHKFFSTHQCFRLCSLLERQWVGVPEVGP